MSRAVVVLALMCACVCGATMVASADDNGFKPLFNGKDLNGWDNGRGGEPGAAWVVEDGALTLTGKGGGYVWTKDRFGDFVLDLEVQTKGNSGLFFRTDDPRNPVQTGIEMQVERQGRPGQKHGFGSLYDLVGPSKEVGKPGEWNRVVLTAVDNKITIEINGEKVIDADLNEWTEPNKNPDGSKNKFKTALKDFKRDGHIGLQDHGAWCSYRNIRIKVIE
jgi:hypothetical protein